MTLVQSALTSESSPHPAHTAPGSTCTGMVSTWPISAFIRERKDASETVTEVKNG